MAHPRSILHRVRQRLGRRGHRRRVSAHPAAATAGATLSSRWWPPALLRGAYHLYQGWGAGLGNAAMGLVFGYAWQRTGRLWPLVIAHGVIDTVAFVGYILLASHLSWLT